MPSFTKDHAEATVKKLRKKGRNGVTVFTIKEKAGRLHRIITVYYNNIKIFGFGIKNGSQRNAGHAWVFEQMHLNQVEGINFANCPLTVEDLVTLLRDRGEIH